MGKEEIFDYVMETPGNTNPNVLRSLLDNDSGDSPIAITYSELKTLRDEGKLSAGATYRMTDFVTKINGSYDLSALGGSGYLHAGKSAEHLYDLILYAVDESHLSEIARAAIHAEDTYFADANIDAWKLLYCIDNDTTRFSWADSVNGKGVVYWMHDEWGNEAWYDFKNVLTVRYALSASDPEDDTGLAYDASTQPNRYGSPYHIFTALNSYITAGEYVNPFPSPYDFSVSGNILGTTQMPSLDETYLSAFDADLYYTFDYFDENGDHIDASLNGNVKVPVVDNVFERESDCVITYLNDGSLKLMGLGYTCFELNSIRTDEYSSNYIIMNSLEKNTWFCTFGNEAATNKIGHGSYSNTFGDSCYRNTLNSMSSSNIFGIGCNDNTFGANCSNNVFGNECAYNTFAEECNNNRFISACNGNMLGRNCDFNTFNTSCGNNAFGASCNNNTFGNNCDNNEFGDYCSSNSFGENCSGNTFKYYCSDNSFGNSCISNTFDNLCSNNTFGNSCGSNIFDAGCRVNTFGVSCNVNALKGQCTYNVLENYTASCSLDYGCKYIQISGGTSGHSVMNYHIIGKVQGGDGSPVSIAGTSDQLFVTNVGYNSSGVLKTWCPADLVV